MAKTLEEFASTEISGLIHRDVSVFKPDEEVTRVLGALKETGRYEAAVSRGDRHGIVTVRDLLDVAQPERTKISSLWMVIGAASPGDRVIDVVDALAKNNVRAVPVVEGKEFVGVVSQVDIVEAMCEVPELSEVKAKDIMRGGIVTLGAGDGVAQARRLMLDKGFSHLPVVNEGKLEGIVTAEEIVHTFITPASKATFGERTGERVNRFPGKVGGVMDPRPLTVGTGASALDVACGLRDHRKGAALMVEGDRVLGIITPRELLGVILRLKPEEELPVYILGLTDEDFFERGVVESKVRRMVQRSMRMHPDISEVSVRAKRQQARGERVRYQLTARVVSPGGQLIARHEGWGLMEAFDGLCDALDRTLRRAKKEPPKRPRRGRRRR